LQFQTLSPDSCFIPINGSIQQDPGITLVSDSEPVNVVSLGDLTITIVKPTCGRTRKVYENGICTSILTNTDNDKSISITESINIDIIDEIGSVVIPSLPLVPKA
jgi:hypothetical protein